MAALAWALWALTLVCYALVAWLNDLLLRGRPARAGPPLLRHPGLRAGHPERDHRRGAGGQPPPRHPVGWLLLGLGLRVALSVLVTATPTTG